MTHHRLLLLILLFLQKRQRETHSTRPIQWRNRRGVAIASGEAIVSGRSLFCEGKFEAHRRVKSWLLAGGETGRGERNAGMLMICFAVNLSTTILLRVTVGFEAVVPPFLGLK